MTESPGPSDLWFLPLGGTGEIGMNLNLYGHDGAWLMVDLGVTFADERASGIDVIMPDPSFIEERAREPGRPRADPCARGPYRRGAPSLAANCAARSTPRPSPLPCCARKLVEPGWLDEAEITEVPMSGRFSVGPFDVELITLTHSIPEPNAVVIRTAAGTVLHTGDWKLDPDPLVGEDYDEAALRALADEGVLAMVCDSTNALVEGESGSEGEVRESLSELIGGLENRVAVACFATNVARLETVMRVAEAHGRRVALVGRSMRRIYKAASRPATSPICRRWSPTRTSRLPAARGGAAALYRQPGRAARGAMAHRPRRPSGDRARAGRRRGVLLAHDPRQREVDLRAAERAGPPGHRGDHRPGAFHPRLRPSGARRAGADVPVGAAQGRDPGARRGPPPGRARRAGRGTARCSRPWSPRTAC